MIWEAVAGLINTFPPALQPPKSWQQWTPGQTPFSTNTQVIAAIITYLAVLWTGQKLMKNQQPYKFAALFQLHNILLSSASGLVLVLMLEEILPIVWKRGFFHAICDTDAWTPRMETLYIINYWFKYWELFDTVFLVVKKKPLQFLHVYHHSATALLCYTQLNGRTSVSWAVITLNLLVHVIMYYYYWATAAGYKIWWKKYVTTMQISQFILDIFIIYFAAYSYFAAVYAPNLPTYGACAGSEQAAILGCVLISSYLVLFISFYKKTYSANVAQGKSRRKSFSNSAEELVDSTYIPPELPRQLRSSSRKNK